MKKIIFLGFISSFGFAATTTRLLLSTPIETDLRPQGIAEAMGVWTDLVKNAKSTLEFEHFYISDKKGESLEPFLKEIVAAAKRGVKVRMLLDAKFFVNMPESVTLLDAEKNIEAKTLDLAPGIQHAKYLIVDGSTAVIGSHNLDWRAFSHIHELGVETQDTCVTQNLSSVFARDWKQGKNVGSKELADLTEIDASTFKNCELNLVASPKKMNPSGVTETLSAIKSLMSSAKNKLYCQVMTYGVNDSHAGTSGWRAIQDQLIAAGKRGVDVRLMVDNKSASYAQTELDELRAAKNVQVKVVKIPEWSGGPIEYARLIHSKYIVADGEDAWVGSENWTEGYFTGSRNVGVVMKSADIGAQLEDIFNLLWKN